MLDQKGFDLWAEDYDKFVGISEEKNTYPFAGYRAVLGNIYQSIMRKPKAVVLDLGFGSGRLTARLYEKGCTVYGQDFSERMIELAAQKMPEARLYQGDFAEGLAEPLLRERYDFIIATYSLHHLGDEQKLLLLQALRKLLNPGGQLLIGDVMFEDREKLEQCRRKVGDAWDEEEIYFVVDELKQMFPEFRFEKISFCAGVLELDCEALRARE